MQRIPDEIVLPITEPETEWIFARPVQKVSPTRSHSIMQGVMYRVLHAWARGTGTVGPEWRFRITPVGEATRPLVPDVAYLSDARAATLPPEDREVPTIAPEIVVEVLSPNDKRADVLEKCRVYRAASVILVLVVDPATRSIERFDSDGTSAFVDENHRDVAAFPGLRLPFGEELFHELDRG